MDILKNCIKDDAFKIVKGIEKLINNININNLDKFKKIYNIIKKHYDKIGFDNIQLEKNINRINKNEEKFNIIINELQNWREIKQIKEELNKVTTILYFKTKYLNLYYVKSSNITEEYGIKQFSKIIKIALTLEDIIPNKIGSIYIFPINYSRKIHKNFFDSKENDIEYLENNYMAFTISGQVFKEKKKVFVIRDEECIKLFIHELLHLLEAEMINGKFVGRKIYNYINQFNIELVGRSFESYTELLSNILNIIFFILNNNYNINILEELIKIEIVYSIYVTSKLLSLYGYTKNNYFDFFIKKNNACKIKNNIPSTYYYIIKSMYYLYFIDWIDLLNENLLLSNDFFNKEIEIINKSIVKDSEYIKYLEQCFDYIVNNSFELSMRYSLIDDNCIDNSNILYKNEIKGGWIKNNKKYIIKLYNYVN
jgi:hypothetical protein